MASYILRKLDEALWRQVKSKAAAEGVTLRALFERWMLDYVKGTK